MYLNTSFSLCLLWLVPASFIIPSCHFSCMSSIIVISLLSPLLSLVVISCHWCCGLTLSVVISCCQRALNTNWACKTWDGDDSWYVGVIGKEKNEVYSCTFPDSSQKFWGLLYSTELHMLLHSNLTFHPLDHGDFGDGQWAYPITATTPTSQASRTIPTTLLTDSPGNPIAASPCRHLQSLVLNPT